MSDDDADYELKAARHEVEIADETIRRLEERASKLRALVEFNLDADELDTILACVKNEQHGRITAYEIRELVRVYRYQLELSEPRGLSASWKAARLIANAIAEKETP